MAGVAAADRIDSGETERNAFGRPVDLTRLGAAMGKVRTAPRGAGTERPSVPRPRLPPPPVDRAELLAELGLGPGIVLPASAVPVARRNRLLWPALIVGVIAVVVILQPWTVGQTAHTPNIIQAFPASALAAPLAQPAGSPLRFNGPPATREPAPQALPGASAIARDFRTPPLPPAPSGPSPDVEGPEPERPDIPSYLGAPQSPLPVAIAAAPPASALASSTVDAAPGSLPGVPGRSIAPERRPEPRPAMRAFTLNDPEKLRVVIHYPVTSGAAASRAVAERLRAAGAGEVEVRIVRFDVETPSVRYFRVGDRTASEAIRHLAFADRPARVADFTRYDPAPRPGTIELWVP